MRSNIKAFLLFVVAFALLACSSGDTEEFNTAVYVNDLGIVSIAIDVDDDQDILDVNEEDEQLVLPVLATLVDGSTVPVTRFLQWSSSAANIISVNGSGIARPVATGGAMITVSLGDFSDSIELKASDAELRGIAIVPSGTPLECSFDQTLKAIGTYEGEVDTRDISKQVAWSPNDATVAVVQNNAEGVPTVLAYRAGGAVLTARKGDISSIPPLAFTILPGTLNSIALTPISVSQLERNKSQNFVATGTYTDASKRNITLASVWTSSLPDILRADTTRGQFTALKVGTANASALCGNNRIGVAAVTVVEPRTVTGIEIRDSDENSLGTLLTKRPTSSDFPLQAWLVYSTGERELIPDDNEDLNWEEKRDSGNVLTVDNTRGNKGFIDLNGNLGEADVEVVFDYSDDKRLTDNLTIKVAIATD